MIGAGSLPRRGAEGAGVCTASLRRRAELLAASDWDLEIVEQHGNVDTRLRRLFEGGLDAIVWRRRGSAGSVARTELAFRIRASEMTPAAGQGALVLQARIADE